PLFTNDLQDIRFLLEVLARMNQDDTWFKGTLDLQRVGTMGWSYGGGVAGEICRTDDRVVAAVFLEAYLQNAHDLTWNGLHKPFLSIYSVATQGLKTLFDEASQDAYWMRIQGTEHQHFADWLAWIHSPSEASRRAAQAMNACMVSFFNRYLKGE